MGGLFVDYAEPVIRFNDVKFCFTIIVQRLIIFTGIIMALLLPIWTKECFSLSWLDFAIENKLYIVLIFGIFLLFL